MGDRELAQFYDRRLAYAMIITALMVIVLGFLGA